jgi:uncharacterized protein YecT (DUF1311 family)
MFAKRIRTALIVAICALPSFGKASADEAPPLENACADDAALSDNFLAVICNSSLLLQLDKSLSKAVWQFTSALEENGQEGLISAFQSQQMRWSSRRREVCTRGEINNSDRTECLERLYRQRIDVLKIGPDGQAASDPNWEQDLLPGEQTGVGGPSGSDYWAIVRCGVDALVLDPGGTLSTTGRSILLPSDQSAELPPDVGGLGVTGDLNETKTTCNWALGNKAAVTFRLSRPIGEPGPCSGAFGVLMTIAVNGREIVKDRDLIGYCGAALLKSVKVDNYAAKICTLSSRDDPARNDPVNALPPISECRSISSQ